MGTYQDAKKICMTSIYDFRCNVNEFLADENGHYLFDWSLKDAKFIKEAIQSIVDDILSTYMADNVSYKLNTIKTKYDNAYKEQDISSCQSLLSQMVEELNIVHASCCGDKIERG